MATCSTEATAYEEKIKTIVLRGTDGITIPKLVRQEAYTLSVDIIVRSIGREVYKNYECSPPESFYGAATLVMQDCLELKIPIKFPRQRIYSGRVSEAYEQWNDLINFEYHKNWHYWTAETTVNLGTALGFGVTPPIGCCSLPIPSWNELPLREVFFHPPIGTQYEIEVSWIVPLPFTDSCGTSYTGYSQQEDGDKDSGLPPNGIQPHVADDFGDPYKWLPPVSTPEEQGAFGNNKAGTLDEVDPANVPVDPTVYYYVPTIYIEGYYYGCANPKYKSFLAFAGVFTSVPTVAFGNTISTYESCGGAAGIRKEVLVNGVNVFTADGLASSLALGMHVTENADGDPDFFYTVRPA